MRRLGPTVARLTALRNASAAGRKVASRLVDAGDFGPNPGALAAKIYVPANLEPGAALVVVLHGCTQNAALYDRGSGWSELADRQGFALLFPEQDRSNNFNLCFNWYQSSDARRNRGEAASIAQMIRHVAKVHSLDPGRVFINGLSAGGAMTSVMLACYPELFAGGAIIAGLPFAVAEGVPEALERMRGQGFPPRGTLASRMTGASDHRRPWPTLSVWHGSADATVAPANAGVIVDQWRDRIGIGDAPGEREMVDGHVRTVWRDSAGKVAIERYDVAGMGHGTPITSRGDGACGQAEAHMLEAGICSTRRLAEFWGIASRAAPSRRTAFKESSPVVKPAGKNGVGAVIEDALRAAGLMR